MKIFFLKLFVIVFLFPVEFIHGMKHPFGGERKPWHQNYVNWFNRFIDKHR